MGFGREYLEVLENVKQLDKRNMGMHGRPKVKSIIYDLWNNISNLFAEPSLVNFLTIFIDYSSYVIMPMEGGYFATNSHDKYKRDEYAYIDAGVTEEFLFIETTNLFKEKFWQFFGLFKRVAETTGIDYEEESQQE